MFLRSIRFRLTFWYALTLAVTLTASSLFWYAALSRNMLNHVDERLLDVAKTVEKKHLLEHQSMVPHEACSDLDAYIIDHTWAGYAQVRDNLGNLICSINIPKGVPLPLDKAALLQITRHLHSFQTIYEYSESPLRMLSYPIFHQKNLERIIQVGEPLSSVEHSLSDLRTIFLMLSPFALLAPPPAVV